MPNKPEANDPGDYSFDKGVVEPHILKPEAAAQPKSERRKSLGKQAKKIIARRKSIDSFLLENLSNHAQVAQFYELFIEDIRERNVGGRPLTREERKLAKLVANGLVGKVDEPGKLEIIRQLEDARFMASGLLGKLKDTLVPGTDRGVFVATVKQRRGLKVVDVPIGYMAYWMAPSGVKINYDRIFVRQSHRGRGYGSRIAMRSLGRAFLRHPEIITATYHQAIPPEDTIYVMKELLGRKFIRRYERENRDYVLYLDLKELQKEADLITSYEKLKRMAWVRRNISREGRRTRKALKERRTEYRKQWGERAPQASRRR
ncbi:MAG: GNAT family N-acetyltransferase [Candidatus Diapherotrites archaeon]